MCGAGDGRGRREGRGRGEGGEGETGALKRVRVAGFEEFRIEIPDTPVDGEASPSFTVCCFSRLFVGAADQCVFL